MYWFKLFLFYLFLVITASECNEIELKLPEKTDISKNFCKNAGNGNKKLIFMSNISSETAILFFYDANSWDGVTSDELFVLADENCNPDRICSLLRFMRRLHTQFFKLIMSSTLIFFLLRSVLARSCYSN
ncbi:uncharacterized protein PRCAT00005783001 [Priceomyces carsonii]|uniref:uncharacterized protein n=1 Tax=Priceomyces carsonii TaxID=28549 RepID=UPI002ED8D1F7|nr:unnamed protein product [Priceomyces carsonii]